MALVEPVFLQGGAVVLVEGEPGVGKTRMLQEVQRDLEWRGAQVIGCKVDPVSASQARDPLVQTLKGGLSPLRIEQMRSLVQPERAAELEATMANSLFSIGQGPSTGTGVYQDRRPAIAQGLASVLSLWSQITPLVIILDDLHWAGEDTWELIGEVVALVFSEKPVGVAILISVRPEEAKAQPWIRAVLARMAAANLLARVELRLLGREATGELIRAFLGIRQPLVQVETSLYHQTGGNPLFVLESLRLLYVQGRLNRGIDGNWRVLPETGSVNTESRTVAPRVESILARRIEQLPPSAVRVVQTLAVLGDSLNFASLRALCAMEPAALLASAHLLVQAHLLAETARDYHFTHDLLRQVAYESIPEEQRRELHSRAGNLLESTCPERVEALAFHFEMGQVLDRAVRLHEKAGESACQRNAYHQAVYHFQKAIAWAAQAGLSPAQCFELYHRREAILDILGERDAQKQDLQAVDRLLARGLA